jgi:hypothetical protein
MIAERGMVVVVSALDPTGFTVVSFPSESLAEPAAVGDIICGKLCALKKVGDAVDIMQGVKPAVRRKDVITGSQLHGCNRHR